MAITEKSLPKVASTKAERRRRAHVPVRKCRSARPTTLELFAGAGGLALGMERAGFEVVGLVENNADCIETLRLNRRKWNTIHASVEDMDYREFHGVDVVTGGFPCQAFSFAGKALGFKDRRGGLFFEMLRCIKAVRPRVVLAENVPGLLRHNGGKSLQVIKAALSSEGYHVHHEMVNALEHGIPQKRKRLIIIACKKADNIPKILPTSKKIYTLHDVLKDCPPSEGVEYSEAKRRVLAMVSPGGCWIDLPDKVQREYMGASYGNRSQQGGRRGMARRMSWDEPSLTVLCSPSQKQTERCHPDEVRPFTVRESARIQTFPDSWKFCGSTLSQYRQIGNAVPVKLGRVIGKLVKSVL